MLVPWPVTAADYVEREMLRIHSHQNGIWLSSNEEERFDRCRTARADMDCPPIPNQRRKVAYWKMTKGRMEAFSDGVFAVIITIMVLELKSPQGTNLAALKPMVPVCSATS